MAQARPTGRFGAASLRARMSLPGRECEFAEVRSCRSGRLASERQVTDALPPEAGHRPKVGSGRRPDGYSDHADCRSWPESCLLALWKRRIQLSSGCCYK